MSHRQHVWVVQVLLLSKLSLRNPPKSSRLNFWELKSKPPSTHQFSLLKPSQTSHWFLITPSCFVYQFKRGELPMAGDTWQILQRQFLHLLVAQALEGWQLVLGAERRFTSEVWVTVKCVSFTVERCFQHRGGYYPDAEICWMLYIILHHQGGDVWSISFIDLTWLTLYHESYSYRQHIFQCRGGYYPETEKCVVYPIPCLPSYS